ncbi:MAG TPA: ABC transporter permease [Blastocatellia bacterium]|nr:ABC transporter permease [Blastocatellia bacterium]
MKRIFAQARKEMTQIFRDRLTIALALGLPLILLVLYGKAISFSVTGVAVVIQDFDNSPRSREYVEQIAASLTFRVVGLPAGMTAEEALGAETARAVVIIPAGFGRVIDRGARGQSTEAQWLIDATDTNTANILRGNATALTQAFSSRLDGGAAREPGVKAETRLWFNPGRDTDKYIGPGVIAVVLALFPPLLAALAMSRESEHKTILQVYVSSISAHEFILGKTTAYFIIALAEWVLVVALGMALFGLRLAGDPTPFLVGTAVYLFCNVAFGTMAGAVIPDQASTIQVVALVCFMLSFLLSGFLFPLSNIPASIRWIAYFVPARYFIEITRDAFLRGGSWAAVWHAELALALLGLVFLSVAWASLRRMQVVS